MIHGSCLCGGVRFALTAVTTPFELCHCTRCRKATGSVYLAAVTARTEDFQLLSGRELVSRFELPVRDQPPPYARVFCRTCGCIVPDPDSTAATLEVAAGLLDDDPGVRPERHILVESKAPWTVI